MENHTKETILEVIKKEQELCFDKEQVVKDVWYRELSYADLTTDKLFTSGIQLLKNKGDLCVSSVNACDENLQSFSSHAEGQLLAKLNIPASYYHRCPDSLKSTNFNYWANEGHLAHKDIILRCKKVDFDGKYLVRGVVSKRFKKEYDDVFTFPLTIEAIEAIGKDVGGVEYRHFHKLDDITILDVLFPSLSREMNFITAVPGIQIMNSEVGVSCFHIRPLVYSINLGSHNYIFDNTNNGSKSFYHTSVFDGPSLGQAVYAAREAAEIGVASLFLMSTQRVKEPLKKIEAIVNNSSIIPKKLMSIFEEEWKEVAEAPKLEMVRSILNAVAELPVFQRYQATAEVGRYLNIFGKKDRIKQIFEEDVSEIDTIE